MGDQFETSKESFLSSVTRVSPYLTTIMTEVIKRRTSAVQSMDERSQKF